MRMSIVEDSGGGLHLTGEGVEGTVPCFSGLEYSQAHGTEVLEHAFYYGVADWTGETYDEPPLGAVVAEYDGERMVLHVQRMGTAARELFGLPHDRP